MQFWINFGKSKICVTYDIPPSHEKDESLNLGKLSRHTNGRSTSEVDFVILEEGEVIPIEVKSGENLKTKSFRLF